MDPTTRSAQIPLPEEVFVIAGVLAHEDRDVQVFAVGGAVRDFLYKEFHGDGTDAFKPKDVDLTTNLSEESILEKCRSRYAVERGVRVKEKTSIDTFGVVFVSIAGSPTIEIAPFRKDVGVGDGRRPESVERGTIEEDAVRRDFTMNNLYYDFMAGRILDFNPDGQGIEDIRGKIVRFVGDPEQRIAEDKLRILRYVRFFSRFNDGDIGDFTGVDAYNAIMKYRRLLEFKGISHERIQTEFLLGLAQCLEPSQYLANLHEFRLFQTIFDGLKVRADSFHVLKGIRNPKVVMAHLLHDNLVRVDDKLNRLCYPNHLSSGTQFLIDLMDLDPHNAVDLIKDRERLFVRVGRSRTDLTEQERRQNEDAQITLDTDIKDVCSIETRRHHVDVMAHFGQYEPVVPSGEELMARGLKGPEIGKEQRRALQEHYLSSLLEQHPHVAKTL